MPQYSEEKENIFIALIRKHLIRQPNLSIRGVKEKLDAEGCDLDVEYVGKLVKRIEEARVKRMENQVLDVEIARFEDLVEALADKLWDIILDVSTTAKDKSRAMRELRQGYESLIDKKFDAGYFERQLGKIKADRELTPEQETLVRTALEFALTPRTNGRKANHRKPVERPEGA